MGCLMSCPRTSYGISYRMNDIPWSSPGIYDICGSCHRTSHGACRGLADGAFDYMHDPHGIINGQHMGHPMGGTKYDTTGHRTGHPMSNPMVRYPMACMTYCGPPHRPSHGTSGGGTTSRGMHDILWTSPWGLLATMVYRSGRMAFYGPTNVIPSGKSSGMGFSHIK